MFAPILRSPYSYGWQRADLVRIRSLHPLPSEYSALLPIPPKITHQYDGRLDFRSKSFDAGHCQDFGWMWGRVHLKCKDNLSRARHLVPGLLEPSADPPIESRRAPKRPRTESFKSHVFEVVAESCLVVRQGNGPSPYQLLLRAKNERQRIRVVIRDKNRCFSMQSTQYF